MDVAGRRPLWSDRLTQPIATRIPECRRPTALRAIKTVHTAAFLLIAGCILVFTSDAIRGRGGHRSLVTAGIAITETLIYGSNNQVAPSRRSRRSSEPGVERCRTCTSRRP